MNITPIYPPYNPNLDRSGTTATWTTYDCIPFERFTPWVVSHKGSKKCTHDWIYADHKDVNVDSNWNTLVYCPCGCPTQTNEARICKTCLRRESRVRTNGYTQEVLESEYSQLLKQLDV